MISGISATLNAHFVGVWHPRVQKIGGDAPWTSRRIWQGGGYRMCGSESKTRPKLVGLLFGLYLIATVRGAMPSRGDSVEYSVAAADLVVRGRILQTQLVDSSGLSVGSGKWRRVTIKVEETLRGPSGPVLHFYTPTGEYAASPRLKWLTKSQEAIFCLDFGSRYARKRLDYASAPLVLNSLSYIGAQGPIPLGLTRDDPVMSARFHEPVSREEILEIARAHCGKQPNPQPVLLVVPRQQNLRGWTSLLCAPLDDTVVARALAWANSNDPTLRWNAVRVLRWAHTPASEAAIRSVARRDAVDAEEEVTRLVALDVLQRWNAIVPTDAHRSGAAESSAAAMSMLLISLFPSVWMYRAFRASSGKRGRMATAPRHLRITLMLLAFLASIWTCSLFHGPGIQAGKYEIAAQQGRLCIFYGRRDDVAYIDPWRPALAADLPVIRAFSCADGFFWRAQLPWTVAGGVTSALQDVAPIWTFAFGVYLPIWVIAAILTIPSAAALFWSRLQRRKRNRSRGFDVVFAPK
jgi:hypothetical protein